MRIGILTFHRAYNYGAFLQCYSLVNRLKEDFPQHTVEVVDYSSKNMIRYYESNAIQKIFEKGSSLSNTMILITKRLTKTILQPQTYFRSIQSQRARERSFKGMTDYLPLSVQKLISDEAEEFRNYLNGKYDVIIVGSDAIWNDYQTASPNMYLLHDIKNCRKLSYAASTYGMDFSNLSEAGRTYVKQSLQDFDFIGVRDCETERYVRECSEGRTLPVHTCDPSVFLDLKTLPADMNVLRRKLMKKGVSFDKPIIGLMCSRWLAEKVRTNLGDGYQYVSVYTCNGCEDVYLDDLNPFEWANVFGLFDATFTHFFHGTMFSIKNGTLTFSIEKDSKYTQHYETKIQDVLKRLGLTQQCYSLNSELDQKKWENIRERIASTVKEDVQRQYQQAIEQEARSYEGFKEELERVINEYRNRENR